MVLAAVAVGGGAVAARLLPVLLLLLLNFVVVQTVVELTCKTIKRDSQIFGYMLEFNGKKKWLFFAGA